MGFAAGFAAGSNAVTSGINTAVMFADLVRKQKKEEAEENKYNAKLLADAKDKEQEFIYKVKQDMAKHETDLGKADTISKYNSALKNLTDAGQYIGVSVGYDPLAKVSIKDKDGVDTQAVIPASITSVDKWRDRYILGKDGMLWERQIENGEFTNNLITTNYKDYSNRFAGTKYGKTLIDVVGNDGNPMKVTQAEYFGNRDKYKLYKEPRQGQKATAFEQDKQAYSEYKEAQKEYLANPTPENKEKMEYLRDIKTKRSRGVSEAGEEGEKPDIKLATYYGREISKDMSTYDSTKAEDFEINFRYTDAYQKNKSLKDMEDDFATQMVSYEQNKALFDVFDAAVKDGSFKSGILTKAINIVGSIAPKEFTDFIGLDREEIKNRLGLEGQLGDGVATYLKGLSGTAASQAEFIRTLNNFSKGDMTQEDVRATILENFVGKKERDLDVMAKRLAKRGLTHTGGEWLNRNNSKKLNITKERVASMSQEEKKKFLMNNLQGL